MNESLIRNYFREFYTTPLPTIIPRDISLDAELRPQIVIGSRRIGKTYLLFQKMQELMENGVKKSQILYINFENYVFSDLNFKEILELLKIFWEIFPESIAQQIHLFFDEIQVIDKWETAMRSLTMFKKYPIYISGSSSKLLHFEIATSFRGRATPIFIYTLSFREFLRFKKFPTPKNLNNLGLKEKAKLNVLFKEYFEYGGYPEVVLAKDIYKKKELLQNYYDLIIYKDLIERYRIRNEHVIKEFIITLIKTTGREISVRKIYNDFKSRGIVTSVDTLYRYLSILEDAGIFYTLNRYDLSFRREMNYKPKIYVHDNGLLSLFSKEDYSTKIENITFMHLKRRSYFEPLSKIYFWKTKKNKEIDFLLLDRDKIIDLIQATYEMEKPETRKREITSLTESIYDINKMLKSQINEGKIIHYGKESTVTAEKIKIEIKNVVQYIHDINAQYLD